MNSRYINGEITSAERGERSPRFLRTLSDPGDQRRTHERQEQLSGVLSFSRIAVLREQPIDGDFDLAHLKAVHAYIFQDSPEHRPGEVREDTFSAWTKNRRLEDAPGTYEVQYASEDIEGKISAALDAFGGPNSLRGLDPEAAGSRMAQLYGDLDFAHGFYEGNSRTLREFTRELAAEAGLTLAWETTGGDARARNALYMARDIEVLQRAFPDLTPERAMQTNDRSEYEASFALEALRRNVGDNTLQAIITRNLDGPEPDRLPVQAVSPTPPPSSTTAERSAGDVDTASRIERARTLEIGDTAKAGTHPDLAAAFAHVARLDLILDEGHVEASERTRVVQILRGELAADLANGVPIEAPAPREAGERAPAAPGPALSSKPDIDIER